MKELFLALFFFTAWPAQYLKLVNDHRTSSDMKSLVYSEAIEAVARKHSLDMAMQDVPFGHDGFSLRCDKIRKRFQKTKLCGEILAWGHDDPLDVFDGWMNSPGHRLKIENPRYTHTGLGFAISEEGHIFWTQIFLEVL